MRLLQVVSDAPNIRIITEDFKYIRWCDEPFRKTTMYSIPVKKIPVGTVMPKNWIRQIKEYMKLYPTYSNGQRTVIFRVCIIELKLIRWDDEPLRVTVGDLADWKYSRVLKGTVTPKYWVLRQEDYYVTWTYS